MQIETLKKANSLQKRIEETEVILRVLNDVEPNDLQKTDTEAECLQTNLFLGLHRNMLTDINISLSTEQAEVLKQAFENHKNNLNTDFCLL